MVGFKDLSGNNPTHFVADRAIPRSFPGVDAGAPYDPGAADSDFARVARSIHVSDITGGAALSVVLPNGTVRIFDGLVAGSILNVQAIGTRAANTTVDEVVPVF